MPAQSPTLSPTLSAMVAGLRGSSSGMPASTLPTRSPPTSAPLVKMPPPRRAKIEISEAPKPSATMRVDHGARVGRKAHRAGEDRVVAGDAEQRQAGHEHAGDGAGLERKLKPAGERADRGLRGAHVGAHRDVHADEARHARQHRADQEADADQPAEQTADDQEDHDADDGDGGVLALEIGLRALAHRGRDLLHPRAAGIGLHHRPDGPDAVHDREQTARDDQSQGCHGILDFYGACQAGPHPAECGADMPKSGPRRNAGYGRIGPKCRG